MDEPLRLRLLDAEGEIGHEALRVRDRDIRKPLADDADLDPAGFADRVGAKDRLVPVELLAVVADEVALEESAALAVAEELLDPVDAVGEFPVRGENLDSELVHDPDHVLAARPESGRRALQGVAAVEEDRLARPFRAGVLDQRRHVGVAAHAAVARRERGEIHAGHGVGLGRAPGERVGLEKRLAREIGRTAGFVSDPDERVGLAVVDGQERRVRIGHVEQGDVAERLEREEPVGLEGGREGAAAGGAKAPGDGDELQQIAARDVHG